MRWWVITTWWTFHTAWPCGRSRRPHALPWMPSGRTDGASNGWGFPYRNRNRNVNPKPSPPDSVGGDTAFSLRRHGWAILRMALAAIGACTLLGWVLGAVGWVVDAWL